MCVLSQQVDSRKPLNTCPVERCPLWASRTACIYRPEEVGLPAPSSWPSWEPVSGFQAPGFRVVQIPSPPTFRCKNALCIWPHEVIPSVLQLRHCGLKLASPPHASSQVTECSVPGQPQDLASATRGSPPNWSKAVDKNACPPLVMRTLPCLLGSRS